MYAIAWLARESTLDNPVIYLQKNKKQNETNTINKGQRKLVLDNDLQP